MKIIMLYSPRSKSTWTHHVLTSKFGLDPSWCEPLLESRRPRQDYDEYPDIINRINQAESACIKISCNDFIDIKSKTLKDDYKKINWNRFDHVITHTRSDVVSAVLSYAYMDMRDKNSWHRKPGEVKIGQPYTADINIMYYLLRGYAMFNVIQQHIINTVDSTKLHHYEFSTVESQIVKDFDLLLQDLSIDLVDNELDYSKLATNYNEIASQAPEILERLLKEVHNPSEYFWLNRNTIL